jgi:hypothetical protein
MILTLRHIDLSFSDGMFMEHAAMNTVFVKFNILNQQHRCYWFDDFWRASDFNGLATPNSQNQPLYGKYTEKYFCANGSTTT